MGPALPAASAELCGWRAGVPRSSGGICRLERLGVRVRGGHGARRRHIGGLPGVIDSWVVPQDGSRGRFGPGPLPFTLPSPPPWPREPLRQNQGSCGPLMGQRDACSPFVPDTPLMRGPHKPSVPFRSKPELPTFPCLAQSPVSASDPGPPQRTLLTWLQAASKEPSAPHCPGAVPSASATLVPGGSSVGERPTLYPTRSSFSLPPVTSLHPTWVGAGAQQVPQPQHRPC